MALTLRSTFGGGYGHNATLRSVITEKSTDTVNNTSLVNVSVYVDTNSYAAFYNLTGLTLTINMGSAGGSANHSVNLNAGTNSNTLIFAKDYTVTHDVGGGKSFQFTATLGINVSNYTSSSHTGTMVLTTLARASSVSANSGTIGSGLTISISRKASSYKHTLRYSWYGKSGTIATSVDTSTTWTPPLDFCNNIPNSTSGLCTIYVDTYSGSTKIGTNQVNVSLSVPSSVVPTLGSISLSDSNSVTAGLLSGSSNTFIQILSRVKVAFNNASGSYSSTITGYRTEVVGKNTSITGNGSSFDVLNFKGQATIRATVTDSRGRTSKAVDVTVNMIEYFAPVLSITGKREGTNNTLIVVDRTAKIAPIAVNNVQKNTLTLSFKYAEKDKTDYTSDSGANYTATASASLLSSKGTLAANFSASKSYDIIATLSDRFTSTEAKITVGTDIVPVFIKKDRAGFGKIPEKANVLDSDWEFNYKGKPIQNFQLTQPDGKVLQTGNAGDDWDNYLDTGFYMGSALSHSPSGGHSWKFMQVFKHLDTWVTQLAFDFQGDYMAFRAKTSGTWMNWKKLVDTTHPNLVTTEWTSTGATGCYYRREGRTVWVKYDVSVTKAGAVSLGNVPQELVKEEMFFLGIAHAQVTSANANIQVTSTGGMALYANTVIRYHSHFSWSI